MTVCNCICDTLPRPHDVEDRHPNPVSCNHAAPSDGLREAAQRLSDAIADQAAIGTDGLFPASRELDARTAYIAALKDLRAALDANPAPAGPRKTCPHCDGAGTVACEDNDPEALNAVR